MLSYDFAKQLTQKYSTSFGLSTGMLAPKIRLDVYAIYAMVRLADEIVDTYQQSDDVETRLNYFEKQVYSAINTGYSSNPIVHAFCLSARKYGIDKDLIEPFFASMRTDLTQPKIVQRLHLWFGRGCWFDVSKGVC